MAQPSLGALFFAKEESIVSSVDYEFITHYSNNG